MGEPIGYEQEQKHRDVLERKSITDQVLENCTISDSRHAGLYSICGLALRLRDLYKWEKGLDPWVEKDASEVLAWIGEKEEKWENLAEEEFRDLIILDQPYDPFATRQINAVLEPHGLIYGAGYVHSLKPTFFLAILEEFKEVNRHPVYILGRELARDLFAVPALSQDDGILVRQDSAKLFLWDQIFHIKKSGREALNFALEALGLNLQDKKALHRSLEKIFQAEIETYIYHELGETEDTVFDRDIWREIIAAFPHTPIEHLVRAVKDFLADTNENGTLRFIVREHKKASLGFYVAFIDGLRKELFPELIEAFPKFTQAGDWNIIEEVLSVGTKNAQYYAETIIKIYRTGKEKNDMTWTQNEMENRLLSHLGAMKGRVG
jgi:hypothetical protein